MLSFSEGITVFSENIIISEGRPASAFLFYTLFFCRACKKKSGLITAGANG